MSDLAAPPNPRTLGPNSAPAPRPAPARRSQGDCHSRRTSLSFGNMALSRPEAGAAGTAHDHGFHPLRVARVIAETADASSFVLEVPDELTQLFAYQAGQFCTFRVRIDDRVFLRCYSMSS